MSWLFIEDQGETIPAAIRDYEFGAALPTGWTLTRDGTALGRSPVDGRWVSYAANTARPEVNPTTLAVSGVVIEPAASQLVFHSRAPLYATNNATSVVDSAVQTPFGLGATKVTPSTADTSHGVNFYFESPRSALIADNSTVALHVAIKPVGAYSRVIFFLQAKDAAYQSCTVELSGAGAIVSHDLIAASVSQDTDGYYSIKMVRDFKAGATKPSCNMSVVPADGDRFFPADGTSHFLIAYFGAEIGDTVTSPIITTGVSLTRPADNLKTEINWSQDHGLSVGIDYTPLTRASFTAIHAANTVTNNSVLELLNRPEGALYRAVSLGVSSALLEAAIPPAGVGRTTVISAGPDHFRIAVDGVQRGVDAAGAMPLGLTALTIGSAGGSSISRGAMIVHRLKLWDEALAQVAVETFSGDLSVVGEAPNTPILDVQQSRVVLPEETSISLVLTLDRSSANTAVSYRTVDDTAKAGVDYAGVSGTLYFEIGETAAQVTILMAERALSEDKTFRFELYNPVNCALANSACTVVLQRVIPAGTVATTKFDFDTATLSPDWTLTRASAANTRNVSGLWQSVAANLPRLHHHAPGISGLLLEPLASEQRLFDSVDAGFATVASTKTAVTTEQTATGMRQLQWRKDATVADHKLTGVLAAPNADMPTGEFTIWFLARPVNHLRWKLRVKGIDNVWRETRINLSGPGSIIASETGTTAYATQDPHFATWYQFGLYRTQTVTANVSAEFELFPVNEDGTASTAGDITHGIDICHAQLEPISGMTSPLMVTAASAKTARSADVFKATPTATWFKHATHTIGVNFIRLRDRPITQRLLMIKDQSVAIAPDDIGFVTTPASLQARIKVQNSGTGSIPAIPNITSADLTTAGVADTAMLVVEATKVAVYHNGAKVGETAALTTPPVVPGALRLGSSEPSGNDPMSLLVLRVYHWNHAIPEVDAKLFSGNLGFVPVGAPPKPIVSIPTKLSVAEGGIINVPVSRTGTAACQVNIRTTQNTALVTTDYTGIGPVAVNFAAGEAGPKMVPIQTVADAIADPNEKFNVKLELIANNTTCALGNATCEVTILEPPRVDITTAVNATEGQNAVVTVTKTGVGACSVTYRTVGDSATVADGDYTAIGSTTLSFTENETTKTVSVAVLQDNKADSSQKFKVVLENPTGCTIGVATCTVTIFDVGVEVPPVGTNYETPTVFAQFSGTSTTASIDFGIGGQPYYVTTRADNATTLTEGTLRHALKQNNRVIVFEVGGVFENSQSTPMRIDGYNLTIAGETAPYPGVILQDGQIDIRANSGKNNPNICLRHVTVERGYDRRDEYNNRADCISIQAFAASGGAGPVRNIWIDHCAFFWAMDECVEVYSHPGDPVMENISFTNCIFAESLFKPETVTNPLTGQKFFGKWEGGTANPRFESEHNYGVLVNPPARRVDLQYCLFSDMYWRVPVMAQNTATVVANTVALNCRLGCTTGGGSVEDYEGPLLLTVDGYLCISGADTGVGSKHTGFRLTSRAQGGTFKGQAVGFRPPGQTPLASAGAFSTGSKVWAKNLYGWKGAKSTYYQPLDVVLGLSDTTTLTETEQQVMNTTAPPVNVPGGVTALSADDLYARACLNVGPRPKERVAHVKRVVDKLIAKDSTFVNHELDVGGFTNGTVWGDHGKKYTVTNTARSLRAQGSTNPPKFKDGTTIPAFPTATDKPAVRAWLRRFLDEVQYD